MPIAEKAAEQEKQKDRGTTLVRKLASDREQLRARQAKAEQAKEGLAGKKQSKAVHASELKPEVQSHANRAQLRQGVAGVGIGSGPGSASGSVISAAAITDAAKSLGPEERARLVRRCAAVLANPTKHNRETVTVCRVVAARR
jgi:hypothetical protein